MMMGWRQPTERDAWGLDKVHPRKWPVEEVEEHTIHGGWEEIAAAKPTLAIRPLPSLRLVGVEARGCSACQRSMRAVFDRSANEDEC